MRYSGLALSEVSPYPISYDSISRWWHDKCFRSRDLCEIAHKHVDPSEPSLIICDETVLAKTRSQKIELVNYQYSGNAHDVIAGIGLINLLSTPTKFRITVS